MQAERAIGTITAMMRAFLRLKALLYTMLSEPVHVLNAIIMCFTLIKFNILAILASDGSFVSVIATMLI